MSNTQTGQLQVAQVANRCEIHRRMLGVSSAVFVTVADVVWFEAEIEGKRVAGPRAMHHWIRSTFRASHSQIVPEEDMGCWW